MNERKTALYRTIKVKRGLESVMAPDRPALIVPSINVYSLAPCRAPIFPVILKALSLKTLFVNPIEIEFSEFRWLQSSKC
jgi:hypothetical protein